MHSVNAQQRSATFQGFFFKHNAFHFFSLYSFCDKSKDKQPFSFFI